MLSKGTRFDRMDRARRAVSGLVLAVFSATSANVWAQAASSAQPPSQQPPVTASPAVPTNSASKAPPTTEQQAEARSRVSRALELADDGDFDASLLELQRAYDLAPTYRILYNIGLVCQQLKEYSRSYDAFERYLSEGGNEVPPDRADDVRKRMDRLRGRIAYVWVTTTEPGAEIFVDDASVGLTPLPSLIRVNSGQRRVTARLTGRQAQTRVLELAGGERRTAAFDLRVPIGVAPSSPINPVPYIAWGGTALITGAAVVTGVLALNATSSYDQTVGTLGINPSQQSDAWDKAHTFSLTTDILIGTAILAAGASIYLTVRSTKQHPKETGIHLGPGAISGQF